MQFLYSPLEQFEPIPFITLYLSNINFSITSISIMFFYIFFILVFFVNGYILEPASSSNLSTSKDKESSVILTNNIDSSLLNSNVSFLSSSLTKEVSYFSFLVDRSSTFYTLIDEKALWVSSPISHSSLRNRYSVIFYKGFYNLLSNQVISFPSTFSYFSDIKAIVLDFLIRFTGVSKSLNNNFSSIKGNQSLYAFSSRAVKSVYNQTFIPKINMFFFESVYELILTQMVKNVLGTDKRAISFFPVLFTLFIFLLFANVGGLVPYSSTVTAYLTVTLTLSIMVMFGVTVYAFKNHGIKFFGHFLPSGSPGWLIPFIIVIEIISFVFRVVSLSVRLFANMMAGHTLFAVLAGFGWTMVTGSMMLSIVTPLPVLVVFILTGLETFVALIQAYVFTILTCIYFEEAINMH
jgi:ATP synthase subunit 6